MSNFKKLLAGTVAAVAMVGVAQADITLDTNNTTRPYIASDTAVPTATTVFSASASATATDANAGGILIDNGAGPGNFTALVFSNLVTVGNNITFRLNQGTFAVLPTITAAGGTLNYVAGGAGQNFITYQVGASPTSIAVGNIQVNGVTAVAPGSQINVEVSDSAGALVPVAAAQKRVTLANFNRPYEFSFNLGAAVAAVDLSPAGATPGSRYTNSNAFNLGQIVIGAAQGVVTWANAAAATTTTGASLAVTLPSGWSSVTLQGACLGGDIVRTTATAGVVTFSGASFTMPAPGTGCTLTVIGAGPTTGSALLGAGPTSAALTLALANAPTSAGSTINFSGALAPISYANGSVFNAGYVVGEDAAYNTFVSVTNGSTPGPVIVNARQGGNSGTAVLSNSLAANTNVLYSVGQIRDALVAAGMPTSTFSNASSRGSLEVVVPTGARVAPLLLNKSNSQVVEISRQ